MDDFVLDRRGPLSEEEQATTERLLGKAAGAEDYFAKRREQTALHAELAERRHERTLMSLPPQIDHAEPGSIRLPRAIFDRLRTAQDSDFTIGDVAVLWAVLSMLENRVSLFKYGRVELIDGEPVLIVQRKRFFLGDINPDPHATGTGPGRIREAEAFRVLVAQDWLAKEEHAGEVHIRRGPKAKELEGEKVTIAS